MNRNKIQNQTSSAINRFSVWNNRNRIKASAVVFSVLVAVGGIISLGMFLFNRSEEIAATGEVDAALTGQIPGWWFQENFGASVCEAEKCKPESDPDNDKLTNYQEYYYKSNPNNADTNNNGNSDGQDVAFGFVPDKPGKVTFEDAGSDDSIVGESLLFNDEIKNVIQSMGDLSKVVLPEVDYSELKISQNNTTDGFITYMTQMDAVSKKYHNPQALQGLDRQIKDQNQDALDQLDLVSKQVSEEYRQIEVPSDALELHKHQIALWRLIPSVVRIPNTSGLGAIYDDSINKWYDSAQSMIALNQKIDIEVIKLRNKYK
jgi:hypothetical protein